MDVKLHPGHLSFSRGLFLSFCGWGPLPAQKPSSNNWPSSELSYCIFVYGIAPCFVHWKAAWRTISQKEWYRGPTHPPWNHTADFAPLPVTSCKGIRTGASAFYLDCTRSQGRSQRAWPGSCVLIRLSNEWSKSFPVLCLCVWSGDSATQPPPTASSER